MFDPSANGQVMMLPTVTMPREVETPALQLEAETAIQVAIMSDKPDESKLLLSDDNFLGCNALDRHGRSLLHLAAAHGMEDIGVAVLKRAHFAHVNCKDLSSRTALHLAAMHGQEKLVKAILGAPDFNEINAKDSLSQRTALIWAAKGSHWGVCEQLILNDQVDLLATDSAGNDVLLVTTEYRREEIARLVATQLKLQGQQRPEPEPGAPNLT